MCEMLRGGMAGRVMRLFQTSDQNDDKHACDKMINDR